MKHFLFCMLALSFGMFAQANETSVDLETLKKITGEYVNAKGDNLKVSLEFHETDESQPSLFGPQEFEFSIVYEGPHGDAYIEMNEGNLIGINEKGTIEFSAQSDCQDPGCTDYEAEILFRKKKDGSYYIEVSVEYVTDAGQAFQESGIIDEDTDIDFDSPSKEEAKILENFCKEYYGDNAYADYAGDLWCYYSVKTYLKKK